MTNSKVDVEDDIVGLMITAFVWMPGSYYLAYEYQKIMVEKNPDDMDSLKDLLDIFYFSPDYSMDINEAHDIAKKLKENGFEYEKTEEVLNSNPDKKIIDNTQEKFNYSRMLHGISDIDFDFEGALKMIKSLSMGELQSTLTSIGKETKSPGVVIFVQYLFLENRSKVYAEIAMVVLKECYKDINGVDYIIKEYEKYINRK